MVLHVQLLILHVRFSRFLEVLDVHFVEGVNCNMQKA